MKRVEGDRIFLDLARDGCGVGCRYCYIAHPRRAVEPVPALEVEDSIEDVRALLTQASSPLLSLGCDTEVAMHRDTVDAAERYLRFAARHELAVQLSTKFPLAVELLDALASWPDDAPAPAVFTTITTVSDASTVEPGAPPPVDRAVNFARHGRRWLSYALVKPFGAASVRDQHRLREFFDLYQPDGIVVGTRYRPSRGRRLLTYPHPFLPGWASDGLDDYAQRFIDLLVGDGFRVFKSTRCVSAFHHGSTHGRVIAERFPNLCVDCGACPRGDSTPDGDNGRRAVAGSAGRGHLRGTVPPRAKIVHELGRSEYSNRLVGDDVTATIRSIREGDHASIERLIQLVEARYKPDSPTHDVSHLARVSSIAGQLASDLNADLFVVTCAAWLHDLHRDSHVAETTFFASPEDFDSAALSFMRESGVREECHSPILEAIHHTDRYSFSGAGLPPDVSIEAKCVRDADNLDALGAIGVARAFSFGGSRHIPIYDPAAPIGDESFDQSVRPSSTIHHFYEKLLRLQGEFETDAALAAAKERTRFLEKFADELLREWNQDVRGLDSV